MGHYKIDMIMHDDLIIGSHAYKINTHALMAVLIGPLLYFELKWKGLMQSESMTARTNETQTGC